MEVLGKGSQRPEATAVSFVRRSTVWRYRRHPLPSAGTRLDIRVIAFWSRAVIVVGRLRRDAAARFRLPILPLLDVLGRLGRVCAGGHRPVGVVVRIWIGVERVRIAIDE